MLIDRYAYTNRLRFVHPGEKAALAAMAVVFCLVSSRILVSGLVIFLMGGLVVFGARVPLRFYLKLMTVPTAFLFVGLLTVALSFSPSPGDFQLSILLPHGAGAVGFTEKGIRASLELLGRSLGSVSGLYFLSLTTPATELFTFLRRLGVPALFVELASLVYRFLFVLLRDAEQIYQAQSIRWGYASLRNSFFSLGQLVASLFKRSYFHSQMLYLALLTRNYNGELKVMAEPRYVSWKDVCFIIAVGIFLLGVALLPQDIDLIRLASGGGGY